MAGWYEIIENPKNIEEWFHNRDVEERRKRYAAFIDGAASTMSQAYANLAKQLIYDTNPLLAKIPKK